MRRRHSSAVTSSAQFSHKFANSSSARVDEFLQRVGRHIHGSTNLAANRRRSYNGSVPRKAAGPQSATADKTKVVVGRSKQTNAPIGSKASNMYLKAIAGARSSIIQAYEAPEEEAPPSPISTHAPTPEPPETHTAILDAEEVDTGEAISEFTHGKETKSTYANFDDHVVQIKRQEQEIATLKKLNADYFDKYEALKAKCKMEKMESERTIKTQSESLAKQKGEHEALKLLHEEEKGVSATLEARSLKQADENRSLRESVKNLHGTIRRVSSQSQEAIDYAAGESKHMVQEIFDLKNSLVHAQQYTLHTALQQMANERMAEKSKLQSIIAHLQAEKIALKELLDSAEQQRDGYAVELQILQNVKESLEKSFAANIDSEIDEGDGIVSESDLESEESIISENTDKSLSKESGAPPRNIGPDQIEKAVEYGVENDDVVMDPPNAPTDHLAGGDYYDGLDLGADRLSDTAMTRDYGDIDAELYSAIESLNVMGTEHRVGAAVDTSEDPEEDLHSVLRGVKDLVVAIPDSPGVPQNER